MAVQDVLVRLFMVAVLAVPATGSRAADSQAAAGVPPLEIRVTPVMTVTADWLASRGGPRSGSVLLTKPEARFTFEDHAHRAVVVDAGAINGRSISALAGDAQGVSSIEGPRAARIFDLFYETPVSRSRDTLVRAGIIDLNAFFYVQGDAAAIFLNGSHGIGPEFSHTGRNGPSVYPNMALAGMLEHAVGMHTIRVGVFDAQPNDPDHPSRMALHVPGQQGALFVGEWDAGRVRAGAWRYTGAFERLDGSGQGHGNAGTYGTVEFQPARALAGWVTAGVSTGAFDPLDSYVGGGLVKTLGRHSIGVAVASAGFADGSPRETTVELTAPIDLGRGFAVQPDVQYVRHPSGGAGSAWVAGVRLHYSYDGSQSPRPLLLRRGRLRPAPGPSTF